jgi:peptidoglycan/xylan/chitin deacetylase (PgdA/CDA1 family)
MHAVKRMRRFLYYSDHGRKIIRASSAVPFVLVLVLVLIGFAFDLKQDDLKVIREAHEPLISILCYHHVDSRYPTPYSVTSALLTAQLDALEKAGFTFVSLKQIEDFYYKDTPLPLRSVAITFDDGNLNVYSVAYPLLKKRGIPFALFIYPGMTTIGHRRLCANWSEVKEMADNGVIIGCHTMTHPFLTLPPKDVTTSAQYDQWLHYQIIESRERIEAHLRRPVLYFAVPFGSFDETVYRKIKQDGYKLSFNVHGMNNGNLSEPLNLNRVVVMSYTTPQRLVSYASLRPILFDMEYPKDLSRIADPEPTLRFKIRNKEKYDKDTIDIRVSTFKGIKLTHQKDTDTYEEKLALQRQRFYIASVTAKDKDGNNCLGNWIFLYNKVLPAFISSEK